MKLTHEIVVIVLETRFRSKSDRVLKGKGKMTAVPMRLQTTEIHDTIGCQNSFWDSEPFLPEAAFALKCLPVFLIQIVKNDRPSLLRLSQDS